ncbi:PREDICTED: N-acetyltransferase 9 isoform X1 [Corvus brachyrhynchos]|uniref:N-acetyltransferase 9 isoform X1 n=1 Tax=Corvus brachyrhynchos TaxID=85066 RepID=UPI0008167108|nr:PREDICTED: N-acetyltransferase 9 isoform X1 [Corvus brachyrhynchos]
MQGYWCDLGDPDTESRRALPKGPRPTLPHPLALAETRSGALGLSLSSEAMKINQDTVLRGKKVTLVPYTAAHVLRYHEWMQSEELQRLTASEPLSLEQEYEMQRSWQDDADTHSEGAATFLFSPECTFIVLDAGCWPGQAEENSMVGDVNLFLTNTEDPTLGEIEIMIAEPSYRGRGFGKEATLLMMAYGVRNLGITKFEAKIGQENEASICMFKKLHFKEVAVNSVFQEVTLRLDVSDQERWWLLEQTNHMEEKSYAELKQAAGVLDT